ncbi:MAG TPA: DNA-directed RNA polymerase subunit beta' [Elusimicrobia bacterium]|nr:DNA-directed RNA polymerase subunit beta' [Elusimicrobiota bacterium]
MKSLLDLFKQFTPDEHFDAIKIGMASPEKIRSWSFGEVKKPETINYRTLKPERDGLFCERIFGPARDFECACGKYRWVKFKGIVCDRCGVEVTESKVRRERMGHIELAVPVAHIWFLKKTPSRIGIVLNMRTSDIERVVYYALYVVLEDLIEAGRTIYHATDLLSEEEVAKAREEYGTKLKIGIGAGAIHDLLARIDGKKECVEMVKEIKTVQSEAERTRLVRRLRLMENFVESGARPEWMIITALPVIPPELRPLVPLEGGRFATSDLNDLYRRIINRNNRLKHIEALRAPEVMVYNEKRLLQEAVDALIENGARGKIVIGAGNRPLKSLSDILKGKQGRFRQNLLGKRVDYSGRSVIIVGPSLKLHQCGLPKEMALELFKPFIIRELMKRDSLTLKAAKRMFEHVRPEIWDILEEVTRKHPVMLNRAPTLHRLGIQAFEPVLIEGKSIQLHPLTCAAFNADFDGDQMAVHVPLSQEAQLEARMLMMATNNILSPASGRPIATPSHDMVLGIHYLTKEKSRARGAGRIFSDIEEVVAAYQMEQMDLHARIKVGGINDLREGSLILKKAQDVAAEVSTWLEERCKVLENSLKSMEKLMETREDRVEKATLKEKIRENTERVLRLRTRFSKREEAIKLKDKLVKEKAPTEKQEADLVRILRLEKADELDWRSAEWKDYTTVGRVLFNEIIPVPLRDYGKNYDKKELANLVERCYKQLGHFTTVKLLDALKSLGYRYSTLAGLSISISEMHVPGIKKVLVEKARNQVKEIEKQAGIGVITESERYNKIIDIWTRVTDHISDVMFDAMKGIEGEDYIWGQPRFNSVYMMANSGARGNRQQVRQLAGMRGLMAKPQKKLVGGVGEIIENPIIANFREGLTVLEYFISTHGGRKGLADTALKTADAGYLTRRLVDVAHDVVVTQEDCGTINGIRISALTAGEEVIEAMDDRLAGRVLQEDLRVSMTDAKGKVTERVLCEAGEMVTNEMREAIRQGGPEAIRVRSVLTCESASGVCAKCYGLNNATGRMVEIGEAVGIIAAQSIGEPGTQLTLRTFHIGGTASRVAKRDRAESKVAGKLEFRGIDTLERGTQVLCMGRSGVIVVHDLATGAVRDEHKIPYGARLKVGDGEKVPAGHVLALWDPYAVPIITQHKGVVALRDVKEGVTLHEERNKVTGIIERRIIEHRAEKAHPRIIIEAGGKEVAAYPLPIDTIVQVDGGQEVEPGVVLAKIPQEITQTKDITGGLPRVSELFEARKPKNVAVVSEIEGIVSLGTSAKGLILITVRDEETDMFKEYPIPQGKHLLVYEGDRVGVGEPLTDGAIDPHDVLRIKGVKEVQEYLLNAIQEVYRLQGVGVSDRHIECIVRQMLQNVRILEAGDTGFLKGEVVNRMYFSNENKAITEKGKKEAQAEPVLLGITKASLASGSFISAASFQETTRVLTEAATTSKIDYLKGLKENVIIGHMIPAGTGLQVRMRARQGLK